MKIVFTATGTGWDSKIDPRFGRAEYLLVYDTIKKDMEIIDNRDVEDEAHGAGPRTVRLVLEQGAEIIITGNGPGGNASIALEKAGVKVFTGAEKMNIKEALEAYNNKQLTEFKR